VILGPVAYWVANVPDNLSTASKKGYFSPFINSDNIIKLNTIV